MQSPIIEIDATTWSLPTTNPRWIAGLEAGKVLYFPNLPFSLLPEERPLINPTLLDTKARNISLAPDGSLKGATGDQHTRTMLAAMIDRFRLQAQTLIHSLLPRYQGALRLAPTSYRPASVATRTQSWRGDDRRLHVDAFPSRPNYGERILRVFSNINPNGMARVWRLGEPFEDVAETMLPRTRPYARWQAHLLKSLRITKSLRSEYDHLMLQLHDVMKSDPVYQKQARQIRMPFPAGSAWVCFSDQTPHAVLSGQYLLEQTLHLSPDDQYDAHHSPLSCLSRLTGRRLV